MVASAEDATPLPPSRWSPLFEAKLRQILSDYEGEDSKVVDGMATGMRRLFEKPYDEELSALRRAGPAAELEPLTTEEAQRVVFFPRLSDMWRYVEAFRQDTPEATRRRERLMKFKLMSVYYTLHRKDGALADRFMHCGGLDALAILLGDDHRVIQSQVVELLMESLSPLMNAAPATSSRQGHLHHQVFSCLCSDAFWQNFAKIIAEPHEVFPKSHDNCIRILAGAIGWLHPNTSDLNAAGPTREGPAGLRGALAKASEALSQFLEHGPRVAPDTRGVAEDLLAELQSAHVVDIRGDPLAGAELEAARKALFSRSSESREDGAHAWQALRKLGNEAFGAGLLWPAEASYSRALEEGANAVPARERSLIESNRALTLLKAGHPTEAAAAAARALEADAQNAKAAYRRAQALLELAAGESPEASLVRSAVEASELAARLEPQDTKVADLVSRARKRMEELCISPQSEPEPAKEPAAAESQCNALESMD